jgi:paraquat-inducible protein A
MLGSQQGVRSERSGLRQELLACRDCGQIHSVAPSEEPRHTLSCVRCGGALRRTPPGGFDRPLALALAAAVLFLLANVYPIFIVNYQGDESSNLLISGVLQLLDYGGALAGLGALVAMLSIIVPGLRLALLIGVLTALRSPQRAPRVIGFGVARPVLAAAWKTAVALRPWSMLDVYLLGGFVAYSRLRNYVDTSIGVGGYALAAFVLSQAVLQLSLGRGRVWEALSGPETATPRAGQPWVQCPDCELVVAAPAADGTAGAAQTCPRCATRLEPRQPGSLAAAAALTAAAAVLYLPANLMPVMTLLYFGAPDTNTILSGVRELYDLGMWPLALLVFFASIVVPMVKLVSIGWFLLAIHRRSAWLLRQRTKLYRLLDFVGRWSNIDVFMISILVALMRFGTLSTVDADPGAVAFAAVVALTMIATRVFDPRLMWDAAAERAR